MSTKEPGDTGNPMLDAFMAGAKEIFGRESWADVAPFVERAWNDLRGPDDPEWEDIRERIWSQWPESP